MALVLLPLIAIAGLAAYVSRTGRDRAVQNHPAARWVLRAALIPLLLLLALSLLLGIGEIAGDVPGGVFHLAPILPIVILAWLAWQRPVAGGVTLLTLGALLATTFFSIMGGDLGFKVQAALITGVPFLASGLLCLLAAAVASRPAAQHR